MGQFRYAITFGILLTFYGVAIAIMSPIASAGSILFPIYIPQECVSLARREGVPAVISNKYEAAKAKFKLARLKASDPLAQECRAAVKRAQRAATEQAKFAREASAR